MYPNRDGRPIATRPATTPGNIPVHSGQLALERTLMLRWLLWRRRSVAALLLAVLAMGCGEARFDVLVSESSRIGISASTKHDVGVVRSTAPVADVGVRGVPADHRTPRAPSDTLRAPCVCVGAIPLSAGAELATAEVLPTLRDPHAGDSLIPLSPVLEPPLRPPVVLAG